VKPIKLRLGDGSTAFVHASLAELRDRVAAAERRGAPTVAIDGARSGRTPQPARSSPSTPSPQLLAKPRALGGPHD